MESYKCPICGNTDIHSIGYRNGKPYCRKCITFRGQEATDEYIQSDSAEYTLHYELSNYQRDYPNNLLRTIKME